MNSEKASSGDFRCGYIAIVGRPNVGKSTLLNAMLDQKISITSRKPQTTRHNILGIRTTDSSQMLFLDTPGMHQGGPRAINRYMNRVAGSAITDVDVIVFVVDRLKWSDEDEMVMQRVKQANVPVIVVVNKIDRLADVAILLPHIKQISEELPEAEYLPLSAVKKTNLESLTIEIEKHLPIAKAFYDEDQVTDRSMRFLAAEIVREKIMRQLGEEVPYAAAVEIEQFKVEGRLTRISALILVEKPGQKTILIGEKGTRLKQIGIDARKSLEEICDSKVMLELWVKVKSGWSDDERSLKSLGYVD